MGGYKLEGIITRGDYSRYCREETDSYVNRKCYRFTEEETKKVYQLLEEKSKIQAVPIVNEQGELVYELRKQTAETESNLLSILKTCGAKQIELLEDFNREFYNPETLYIVKFKQDLVMIQKRMKDYCKKGLVNVLNTQSFGKLITPNVQLDLYQHRMKYGLELLTDCFDNIILLDSNAEVVNEVENKIHTINSSTNVLRISMDDIILKEDGRYHYDMDLEGETVLLSFFLIMQEVCIYHYSNPLVCVLFTELMGVFNADMEIISYSNMDCNNYLFPELKEKGVNVIVIDGNIQENKAQYQKKNPDGMVGWEAQFRSGYKRLADIVCGDRMVIDGERLTVGNLKKIKKNIFLYGPCTILGSYVNDEQTISSFMQKLIHQMSLRYNVRNKGWIFNWIHYRIRETIFQKGDIVIVFTRDVKIFRESGYPVYSIQQVFDSFGDDLYDNIYDNPLHCNEKVNERIADEFMKILIENHYLTEEEPDDTVEPFMLKKRKRTTYLTDEEEETLQNWVKQYKQELPKEANIGSIVMNCNPFTLGHRYLVEYASARVDYLYLFVVEEDRSVFPFEDRFRLVCEGCKDLENVIVIPSGEFIISGKTLSGYFQKEVIQPSDVHTSYDTVLFAEYVAPAFDVSVRFVGEEPIDAFTNNYNQMMKKNFPFYGLTLVEIPRIEKDGQVISASRVRKYLDEKNFEEIKKLVPDTTYQYLLGKYGK